jgi:class 3 adenylate cyclase
MEFSRNIMWLFATPLMLQMYCDVNTIKLKDINIQYHIIPVAINVFIYPYKNTITYYYFTWFSWLMLLFFMKTLYSKRNIIFTNVYLFIWLIFMLLNIIDLFQITNIYNINLYYSYADVISKMMTCIIVNDYNEKELTQLNTMDLQSVQFVSYMIKHIKNYKNENAIITHQCNQFIDFTTQRFLVKIPENKTILQQELLKKILPFNFDKEYISNTNTDLNANANAKQFNMICVLFTDIINYTELSKKYDDKIIFQLLYCIYTAFDNVIKKYPHLQKIETIGDAYMVVGDIFRNSANHKVVVKEIILFALDIVKEIKKIKTPDNIPLCIRIGINMGSVSVGILGNEIPRLCVVGNTVNMASRLQSTAEIDTIQLSKHIYEHLEEIEFDIKFEVIPKENVFLKNIGSITTYNIPPPTL